MIAGVATRIREEERPAVRTGPERMEDVALGAVEKTLFIISIDMLWDL